MVVKINPPATQCASAFLYNQLKVEGGVATILYVANVDDPDNPVETLERYERGSLRCEKTSFHMSINPSDTDGMSEEQVVEFAKELMAGLGYGNQPYIIYKHMDTGRVHYHVVSVRVDKEGKKINDSNEKRRCQALMKKLAAKYGFTIGKGEKKEADIDGKAFTSKAAAHFLDPELFEKWLQDNPPPEGIPEDAVITERVRYKKFDPKKGEYAHQIEEIMEQAMKYDFRDIKQFKDMMRSFRIEVEFQRKGLSLYVTFAGLDPKTGKRCTEKMHSTKLNVPNPEAISLHMEHCQEKPHAEDKTRVCNALRIALNHGTSEKDCRKILAKMNISVVLNKAKGGRIEDVTLVDHQTRCVFRSNELKGMGLGAAEFEKARVERWGEPPAKDEEEKKNAQFLDDLEDILEIFSHGRNRRHDDDVYKRSYRKTGPRRKY